MSNPKIQNLRKKVQRRAEVLAALIDDPKSNRSEVLRALDDYNEVKISLDSEEVRVKLEDPAWREKAKQALLELVDEADLIGYGTPAAAEPAPEKV